ncbi:MAG: histidine kinase [Chitinophagaceae bacterium]|nr:MAG: histidine kinase [Chitinophagaceae bacterium]
MTKKQLAAVYGVVVFMMVWGFDLLSALKFNEPITLAKVLRVFALTQVIYSIATLLLTRALFRTYFLSKQYWRLLAGMAGMLVFFIALRYFLEEVFVGSLFGYHNYSKSVSFSYYALDNLYYALVYLVLGFLIFLLDNQIVTQKTQALLLQKTREAELQFLRSQINPHFLFNTLNNIYSLVYEQSPKAPEAVLKLAELMRYLLYEQKEKVPLSREWQYVQNFIELQRMRFPQELPLQVKTEGDVEKHEIVPHVLIGFVENAFKHGDFKDPSMPLRITLACNGSTVRFETENKIGRLQKDASGGVGLDNIRRRLALLYPEQHSLQIFRKDDLYHSQLILNIN